FAAQYARSHRRDRDDDRDRQAEIDSDMPQILVEDGLPERRLELRIERQPRKTRLQLPRMRQIRQILPRESLASDHCSSTLAHRAEKCGTCISILCKSG